MVPITDFLKECIQIDEKDEDTIKELMNYKNKMICLKVE